MDCNFAKKNEDGSVVKLDGKHVYERKVDFSEYLEKYNEESERHPPKRSTLMLLKYLKSILIRYVKYYIFSIWHTKHQNT